MIAKDGQPAESDSQSNYEAAVLDFLDNEMVDGPSTLTEKKQSEELDALVADLMHQVMTESDQVQTGEMMVASEDMSDLLAEFIPQQDTISLPESENASPDQEAVQTESLSSEYEDSLSQDAAELPVPESPIEQTPEVEASPPITAAIFATPAVQKSRTPMIAAATVCMLVVIGIAAYHFSGSSGKVPNFDSQSAVPVATVPVITNQTTQPSVRPAVKSHASRIVSPVADKKPAAANPKTPDPVATMQKTPPSQIAPPPAKEEKPAEKQVAQIAPPVMPQVVPEKMTPPVLPSNPTPASAVSEKKPAQLTPIVPANADRDAPAPPPQAPAPVVSSDLVPAVVISQVSPKYPEFALRTRTSASVVLELDIDKQGRVVKATPVNGPAMFYKEAINAAIQWRYRPASVGGTNVSSQVKVTFNFNLKN
jgi:TonB family protein